MQEIINKLIEVDKSARKKVEQAQSRKADVINEIEKKRDDIKVRTQQEFERISAENRLKAEQDFLEKYSEEKVALYNRQAIEELDRVYAQNREKWIEEMFEAVIL